MRLNKAAALRCGKCDYLWHTCIDYSFVPGGRGLQQENWDSTTWTQADKSAQRRRLKSPRTKRSATPRRSRKDKDGGPYAMPALDPPWNGKVSTVAAPANAEMAKSQAEHPAEQKLQRLVAALEKQDVQLDPEIQQIVEETTFKPASSKQMHSAVAKLDQARKKLHNAQAARQNHQDKWSKYLEESIKRWKKFAEDFAAQDKDLESRVIQAKEKLQDARTVLDDTKEQLSKQDEEFLNEPEMISDVEEDMESSAKIQAGITTVVASLEAIRVRRSSEDAEEEGTSVKKPRIEGKGAGGPLASPGSKMLEPFAKAGR